MRTAIIVDAFPFRTETFIIRHIKGLNADVLAVSMDESDMKGWANRPYVAGQFYKQRRKKKIANRMYNQKDSQNPHCSEDSVYSAEPDSEYGWEKLFSERSSFLS